jgi:hypothetical protein
MAKRDDKNSMAENYLAQVEWENNHQVDNRGHAPWKNAPNWKYKRDYGASRYNNIISLFGEIVWLAFVISTAGYLLYQIIFAHNGKVIFISILVLILLAFHYFMTRETRK